MWSDRGTAEGGNPPALPARANGFTLLETLVALVVASILSIGLVRYLAASNHIVRHADERMAVATLVAELGAALPAPEKLVAFERSGARGDLSWTIRAAPMPLPRRPARKTALEGEEEATPPLPPWRRYLVDIEIRSGEAVVDRTRTLRLGKPPPEPSP